MIASVFDDGDRDAVLAALRRENSCDPILRAQSRATLKFYVDFVRYSYFCEINMLFHQYVYF